ncbi:MAG: YgjP-like metallopeptidase domain-containing protein [Coriobacteriia bacterium]|nr:YgjP-like metallopeptidase domain-containing protein [Coriobacteriia bacterium]
MQPPNADADAGAALPEYTVRRSSRARRARITVSPRHGVVVTVPAGWRGFDAAAIVAERREWIAEVSEQFGEQRALWTVDPAELLPDRVHLEATGEEWAVHYRATAATTVRVIESSDTLTVSGATQDATACLAALQRWLQAAANERLVPRIDELARRHGLVPTRVTVRGQHARWGGCSGRGAITLNRALLFLPEDLVAAVMVHELAHLSHPNHSPRFWAHLAKLDPLCDVHRAAIRDAWNRVPAWAERRA